MSSYTAFAFHIKVRPEYIKVVDDMLNVFEEHVPQFGDTFLETYENYPYTKEYCTMDRPTMIPYGYMETSIEDATYSDGAPIIKNRNSWNKETGEWEVGCAVNYGYAEIDYYKHKILPVIAEECYYIYEQSEYYSNYEAYTIRNGKPVLTQGFKLLSWDTIEEKNLQN